jgi:hypothetical protein
MSLIEKFDRRFSDPERMPSGEDVAWMMAYMSDAASSLHSQPYLRGRMEDFTMGASRLLSNIAHQNRGMRISQYMYGNMKWVIDSYRQVWGEPSFQI